MTRRIFKNLHLAALAALCALALTGCGASFNAADLVQGNLDVLYHNQYTDEYLQSVELTAEEADQEYEDGIAAEMEYFAYYFEVDLDTCDDTIAPQITELYHQIYDHSKYEVGSATKSDDTYLVSLTVYPIDIMQKVMDEDVDAFLEDWSARNDAGAFADMSDEAFETLWAQEVIDLVSARVDSIDYLEPETISVQVTKDTDGYYCISDNDFTRIDELIIAY